MPLMQKTSSHHHTVAAAYSYGRPDGVSYEKKYSSSAWWPIEVMVTRRRAYLLSSAQVGGGHEM